MRDNNLQKYILGELPAAEQEQFEEQYFLDENLLAELSVCVDQMVADYVSQAMPIAQRARFEARLQALPFLRDQAVVVKALQHFQENSQRSVAATQIEIPQKRGNLFANLLQGKIYPLLAASVCALLLIGLGIWWMREPAPQIATQQNNAVSPAQTVTPQSSLPNTPPNIPTASASEQAQNPVASPSPNIKAPAANTSGLAMILLSPQVTRSESQTPKLQLPAGTQQLQLELEIADEPAKSYQAQLQTRDGKIIKSWDRVATSKNSSLPIVRLRMSATAINAGEYEVVLLDPLAQTRQIYSLQITRK